MRECPECGAAVDATPILADAQRYLRRALLAAAFFMLLLDAPFATTIILYELRSGMTGFTSGLQMCAAVLTWCLGLLCSALFIQGWLQLRKHRRPNLMRALWLSVVQLVGRFVMILWLTGVFG
jgi:hypothetical protein